jgi:hypothetical protein
MPRIEIKLRGEMGWVPGAELSVLTTDQIVRFYREELDGPITRLFDN